MLFISSYVDTMKVRFLDHLQAFFYKPVAEWQP